MDSNLPGCLIEAARIDGASQIKIFNSIILPLTKPAIAVQAIFTFVASWNNYFTPNLIINSKMKKTLRILLAEVDLIDGQVVLRNILQLLRQHAGCAVAAGGQFAQAARQILGAVMRLSEGRADPIEAEALLIERLEQLGQSEQSEGPDHPERPGQA